MANLAQAEEYIRQGLWPWDEAISAKKVKNIMGSLPGDADMLAEAGRVADELIKTVLTYFPDDGKQPFDMASIELALKHLTLFEMEIDFKAAFGFDQTKTVREYLYELRKQTLENDILVTLLAYSNQKFCLFVRQTREIEEKWARRVLPFSYVISRVTEACCADPELLGKVFEHLQRVMQQKGWKDGLKQIDKLPGKDWLSAKFGMIKRRSVTFLKFSEDNGDLMKENPFWNFAFSMNIAEAVLMDGLLGSPSNARAGLSLAKAPNIFRISNERLREDVLGQSEGIGYHSSLLPRNYTDLYVSWNLCFICRSFGQYAPYHLTSIFHTATMGYADSPSSTKFWVPRAISLTLYAQFSESYYTWLNGTYGIPDPDSTFINQKFVKKWSRLNALYAKGFHSMNQTLTSEFVAPTENKGPTNTDLTLQLLQHSLTSAVRDPTAKMLIRQLETLVSTLSISHTIGELSNTNGLTERVLEERMETVFGQSCWLQRVVASCIYSLRFGSILS